MTYKLIFKPTASEEWKRLDGSVKAQFKKILARRLEEPRVDSAKLTSMKDCYKIKLMATGYRLVYQVDDGVVTVTVIAIGRRDKGLVYEQALRRL